MAGNNEGYQSVLTRVEPTHQNDSPIPISEAFLQEKRSKLSYRAGQVVRKALDSITPKITAVNGFCSRHIVKIWGVFTFVITLGLFGFIYSDTQKLTWASLNPGVEKKADGSFSLVKLGDKFSKKVVIREVKDPGDNQGRQYMFSNVWCNTKCENATYKMRILIEYRYNQATLYNLYLGEGVYGSEKLVQREIARRMEELISQNSKLGAADLDGMNTFLMKSVADIKAAQASMGIDIVDTQIQVE